MRSLQVMECGEPLRRRLVIKPVEDDTTISEVVLRVQGILSSKDLPPLSTMPQYARHYILLFCHI